jgi:serine/threonine protein kinase
MSGVNVLETIIDPDFYESIDYYPAREDEFLDLVKTLAPEDWQFNKTNGIWFGCYPPEGSGRQTPSQGWKIHVSSSRGSAQEVLKAVVPVLTRRAIGFKFALDLRMLSLMNSKRWVRQGAGKFITIYPHDEEEFKEVMEELHQATTGFVGPYILSDRRYKNSRVLFYRYGGITPYQVLNVKGEKTSMLVSPSGEAVPDIRYPYFFVPDWTQDPFGSPSNADLQAQARLLGIGLKNGRYSVKSAISFSNSGGVYVAEDMETGQEVVIKEARPRVDTTEDTVLLLKKEYRILSKIAHMKVAPQPVDFFQDWEHFFLVQEFIRGSSIQGFSARNNVTLLAEPTIADTEKYYKDFKAIISQVAEIIRGLHASGIVFSDLSPSNLILNPETLELKIIDFEGAYEIGVDNPIVLYTPGFAYADQMAGRPATFESDYFSLGAIMHFILSPVNQIFLIHPKARYTFIENVTRDIGLPRAICELATALVDKEIENRPTPSQVIEVLKRDEHVAAPNFAIDGPEADPVYRQYVKDVVKYILANATYDRKDRLFPSAGAIFRTNPLSIAHGACGVACVLKQTEHEVPEQVLDWILARNKNRALYPPGLYLGLAGIAWVMLDLGLLRESQEVLSSTYDHPLLREECDIYYGISGWGLANLRFFAEFQDELYLDKAKQAGKHLLDSVVRDARGCYWKSGDEIPLGYAHGASGISLFLLYLYLASGDERYLETGTSALEFDLNNATSYRSGEGLSWKRNADKGNIVYPYWIYGAAGVGTAVLRYYRLLGDEKYRTILDQIYKETNKKYTVFPGLFKGLAGLGEFILDLHEFTKAERYLDGAYKVATGLSLFKIERKEGLAFPGEFLRRISCDYGTGSAGVAHFLLRLTEKRQGAFLLDGMFAYAGRSSEAAAVCQ